MEKLNKTQIKELINTIKEETELQRLPINVFRAIKEFILKRQDHIYKYTNDLYFIGNDWLYNIKDLMNIEPIPENDKCLFSGFCIDNDDTYHYWLKSKKTLSLYGITYQDYKNFESTNWFTTCDGMLYINNTYYPRVVNRATNYC